MNWGGYAEKGSVLHGLLDNGRPACGAPVTMTVGVPPELMGEMAVCKRCRATERGRPVYVYRLEVEYPEGIDWRNPPKGWVPNVIDGPEGQDVQLFTWPARKHYMSRSGAETRADILREWGCKVVINRSNPVTWEEP